MGKVTSLYGKTTGKIGSIVFSTSGGETIAREYNPHVANPSTQAQVNQRARMKLMSQLSASLAPVIAMTKEGLVSKRNKFVKANFENSYASDGVAQISYENVQITPGQSGLPRIKWFVYNEPEGAKINVSLPENPSASINRVVWCLFEKTDEGKLSFVTSKIVSQRQGESENRFFEATFSAAVDAEAGTLTKSYVIYAYGMSDTSESASAKYGNLNVQNATDLARLVATRTITFEDYSFTQTRGASANSGSSQSSDVPAGSVRIFATALGEGGTVTGGGTYEIGETVELTATPSPGYRFNAWLKNGTSQVLSNSNPWEFDATDQLDVIASFVVDGGGGL